MKDSIKLKLANLQDRYEELAALLSDAEIIANQERFRALSKEFAEIEPVVKAYTQYEAVLDQLQQAREMQKDADSDIRAMADEEVKSIEAGIDELELELQKLLLPKDEKDSCNIFSKSAPGQAGMRRPFFPAISSACIPVTRRHRVGGWRY